LRGAKNGRAQAKLVIVYPINGDLFKVDPVLRPEYQSIKILAAAPEHSTDLVLRVDNDSMAFNPSGVWWTLRRGKHAMQLEAVEGSEKCRSERVTIFVE
jgi:hypothetical protein